MLQPGRIDKAPEKSGTMSDQATEAASFISLYRRAFAEYGTQALWNKCLLDAPTKEDALVVARALRIEGDREARRLAEQIEQACRAGLPCHSLRFKPRFSICWRHTGTRKATSREQPR